MSVQNKMSVSATTATDITRKDVRDSRLKNYNSNIIPSKYERDVNADIFADVKSLLEMKSAVEYYGVQVNSRGFALCPFHAEKTPSFKVYDSSFHCFGCGAGGTVIRRRGKNAEDAASYDGMTAVIPLQSLGEI